MNPEPILAYKCKKCKRTYVLLDLAEQCCMLRDCEVCGKQVDRQYYRACAGCRELKAIKQFEQRKQGPTDTFVWSDYLGEYIQVEYLYDRWGDDPPEGFTGEESLITIIREWRLYACKPFTPQWEGICEWGSDYLNEDGEPPGEAYKVDEIFYEYLESCGPWCYNSTNIRWDGT